MKKLLSICLSVVLLLSVVATSVVSATSDIPVFDETKPYIKATSEPVVPGEIAKVTFAVGNNKGFWGINQTYKFDTSVLSFVEGETNEYGTFPKVDKGEGFKNSLISPINDKGEFTFTYTEIYNDVEIKANKSNGELFSIYFKVADDAPFGTYNIDMVDYDAENYLSIAGKPVEFTFNQPSVVVVDPTTTTTTVVEKPSSSVTVPTQSTTQTTANPVETTTTTTSTAKTDKTTTTTTKPVETTTTTTAPAICEHDFNDIVVKNAKKETYFAAGYSGDKVCGNCDTELSKGTTIKKLTLKTPKFKLIKGKKQFKVKYTKVADATGFQVRYRIKGKWKVKTYNTKKKVTKTIKKLKKGTYKVQVRAMVKKGKQTAYSKWAKQAKVKVK